MTGRQKDGIKYAFNISKARKQANKEAIETQPLGETSELQAMAYYAVKNKFFLLLATFIIENIFLIVLGRF